MFLCFQYRPIGYPSGERCINERDRRTTQGCDDGVYTRITKGGRRCKANASVIVFLIREWEPKSGTNMETRRPVRYQHSLSLFINQDPRTSHAEVARTRLRGVDNARTTMITAVVDNHVASGRQSMSPEKAENRGQIDMNAEKTHRRRCIRLCPHRRAATMAS